MPDLVETYEDIAANVRRFNQDWEDGDEFIVNRKFGIETEMLREQSDLPL